MKLPKPRKRGETYTITVTYQNTRYYCTRDTAKECEKWAALKLLELKAGKGQEQENKDDEKPEPYPFSKLFDIYKTDVADKTPSKDWVKTQYDNFSERFGTLAVKSIHDITPLDLTNWRNERAKSISDGTLLKEISFFSAMFTYAHKELFLISRNPWFEISRPEQPEARYRRIKQHEIDTVLAALNYEIGQVPTKAEHYVAWGFLFAIETAMRRGEILSMRKSHISDGYVHLPKTKNGSKRDVPLSKFAKELLALISHDGDKIIPQTNDAFRQLWEKRKKKMGIEDLHFHDTRHEAISRMVKVRKLPVEVLSKITGHKKVEVLINVYYHPDADELVEMFNSIHDD